MTKRAAAYYRVSSDPQAGDEHESLPGQQQACLRVAEQYDIELIAELEEVESATDRKSKRPKFERLVKMAEEGQIDYIVCRDLDRLLRSMGDGQKLLDAWDVNPNLEIILSSGKQDWESFGFLVAAADREVRVTKKRVERGWRKRMRQGKPGPGKHLKYGYRKNTEEGPMNGFAEIHPENGEHVRGMFKLYAEGMAARELFETMAARGCTRKLSRMCLNRIIKDKAYLTGVQKATRGKGRNEETFEVKYPPIIDDVTWAAAQKRLNANRGRHRSHYIKHPALLSGLIGCEAHDYAMHLLSKPPAKYRCGFHGKNPRKALNADCAKSYHVEKLDQMAWEMVRDFVSSPTRINEIVDARAAELSISIRENVEDEIARLAKRLDELEDKRQRQINAYGEGIISKDDLGFQITNLDFEKAAVQRELAIAESELMVKMEPEAVKKATMKMLQSTDWKAAQNENFQDDIEAARKLVRQVLDKVTIGPGFEYVGDNGEVAVTPKVPTMYFRIEVPELDLDLGEEVDFAHSSAFVKGDEEEIPVLYRTTASC